MPSQPPTAKEIFVELIGNVPADQWDQRLPGLCQGDDDLLRRVNALLKAHADPSSFLDAPPSAVAIDPGPTTAGTAAQRPGTQIGPYKLLQQIGEGGMGVVYMAEQKEPVERRVALKIIKPGMDTRQVIARFEAERQALAVMDHPNIARVLDAGATDSGRPYFVMELVNGIPITKYCDEKHLSLKERLELMIPVCQAIQHAHQKGSIHRDIKPTNVLVAQYDGRPVPKVIDFGVAKATAQTLTERTMFTELGQVVGTLEYMSPEQAELNQIDIDTRSDIYSLGVLLYELLTGSTPFDKQKLRTAAFHEMLRIIREDEPEKPSTRLSQSSHHAPREEPGSVTRSVTTTLASIAAVRSTEPARLSKLVKGELDWIVMKALEKDRSRRYETAADFAADVQRFLSDEQVHACPPSARYRFGKFARRNRAALTTAALIAIALIVGTIVSTWQAIRATRAEALALANERRAEAEEKNALAAAAAERAAKEAEAEQRRQAEQQTRISEGQRQLLENNERINATVTDEILSVLRRAPIPDTNRQSMLVLALNQLKHLDPARRVIAFHSAGKLFVALDELPAAISAFNNGLTLDPSNPAILVSRGDTYFRLEQFDQAAEDYTAAIQNLKQGDQAQSLVPFARRAFVRCRLGQFEQALGDFRDSYENSPQKTLTAIERGFRGADPIQAPLDERLHHGIFPLIDRYVADQNHSADARLFAADVLAELKQFDEARRHVEAAEATGTRSSPLYHRLSLLAIRRGDVEEYRRICRTAIVSVAGSSEEELRTRWVGPMWNFFVHAPGGLDDYSIVIDITRRAQAQKPDNAFYRFVLGAALFRAGRLDEARIWLERSLETTVGSQAEYVFSRFYLAMIASRQGQSEAAHALLSEAVEKAEGTRRFNWRFEQVWQSLRREAEQLIGPPPPEKKE
jgi:serine/threonine protein kinase/tetratricopeptide (TPR) repeat protein